MKHGFVAALLMLTIGTIYSADSAVVATPLVTTDNTDSVHNSYCTGTSHNFQVDGAKAITTDAADVIVLYGWGSNCLKHTSDQYPQVALTFSGSVVTGYTFCRNGIRFAPGLQSPHIFPSHDAWAGPDPGGWGRWAAWPTGPNDKPDTRMYIHNQTDNDMQWTARVYTGYYKLKAGMKDADGKKQCADATSQFIAADPHIP